MVHPISSSTYPMIKHLVQEKVTVCAVGIALAIYGITTTLAANLDTIPFIESDTQIEYGMTDEDIPEINATENDVAFDLASEELIGDDASWWSQWWSEIF